MKIIHTLLLLLICSVSFGQTFFDSSIISKKMLKKIKQIPVYNSTFHTEYFREKFDNIFKKADDNELYELTNHSNPLIRRSALYVLVTRNSGKVIELLDKNSADTTQYFLIQFGCFRYYETFLDELLSFLDPQFHFEKYFNISHDQKEMILEMISRRKK